MLFLGIVYGCHQYFLAVARFLVDAKKLLTLLLKNGSFFHVGLLSTVAARSHDLHGNPRRLFNVPRASCPMAFVDILGAPHVICKAPRASEGNASRASLKAHSHPLHETLGWYQPRFSWTCLDRRLRHISICLHPTHCAKPRICHDLRSFAKKFVRNPG